MLLLSGRYLSLKNKQQLQYNVYEFYGNDISIWDNGPVDSFIRTIFLAVRIEQFKKIKLESGKNTDFIQCFCCYRLFLYFIIPTKDYELHILRNGGRSRLERISKKETKVRVIFALPNIQPSHALLRLPARGLRSRGAVKYLALFAPSLQ